MHVQLKKQHLDLIHHALDILESDYDCDGGEDTIAEINEVRETLHKYENKNERKKLISEVDRLTTKKIKEFKKNPDLFVKNTKE